MNALQLLWPARGVWAGRSPQGEAAGCVAGRPVLPPEAALLPLVAPASAGGPLLWLTATGDVVAEAGRPTLREIAMGAGDPGLLAAARWDGSLLLLREEVCTTVELPAVPLAMDVLGTAERAPATALLALQDMVWSLEWSGAQVALRPLIAGVASEVHLLAGRPDAACVRLPGGGADRLHVFLRRAVPWWHWAAQPPLLLEPGQPLLARQEDDGLRVRVREGLWLRAGAQGWQRCAVAEGVGVPTRVFGCRAALDLQPWAEKQQIPSPAKLAVGQGRQGTQERMFRERSYPRQARFVHGPTSG